MAASSPPSEPPKSLMSKLSADLQRLLPLPPNRVWRTYPGGRTLDQLEGKAEPADTHFPEDWIGSLTRAINPGREDVHEGVAEVSIDGERHPLPDLIARDPAYFLGADHVTAYGERTMLLVKYLDAAVRLHFQCHPTRAFSRQHLRSDFGKTEAYYILEARPETSDPYIYLGFQHPPTRQRFRDMILQQDIAAMEACFEKVPVKPGDAFIIPGGLPHAIGEGVFMVEIMEPSDWAARIEFSKSGFVLPEAARFLGRGIDFALDLFNFDAIPPDDVRARYRPQPREIGRPGPEAVHEALIGPEQTPCFHVQRLRGRGHFRWESDRFGFVLVTRGVGTAVTPDGHVEQLHRYGRYFAPAGLGAVEFAADDELELLVCLPPEPSS